jgi:hypothetical protein
MTERSSRKSAVSSSQKRTIPKTTEMVGSGCRSETGSSKGGSVASNAVMRAARNPPRASAYGACPVSNSGSTGGSAKTTKTAKKVKTTGSSAKKKPPTKDANPTKATKATKSRGSSAERGGASGGSPAYRAVMAHVNNQDKYRHGGSDKAIDGLFVSHPPTSVSKGSPHASFGVSALQSPPSVISAQINRLPIRLDSTQFGTSTGNNAGRVPFSLSGTPRASAPANIDSIPKSRWP